MTIQFLPLRLGHGQVIGRGSDGITYVLDQLNALGDAQAFRIHGLETAQHEMAYHVLGHGHLCGADGEVQIVRDYRSRLSIAAQARREVLSELEGSMEAEALRQRIYRRCHAIQAQRGIR